MDNSTLQNLPTDSPIELGSFIWTTEAVVKSVFYGATALGTILGNSAVLIAFIKYKKELRAPTHFFLANLALADLLVGILTLPYLAVFSVTLRWYFGETFCWIWTILHFTFCSCSILSTLCVCIERFIGVRYPLKHLHSLTSRVVLLMVLCCWTVAMILAAVPILIWPETPSTKPLDCKINFRLGHVITASLGVFHIPATFMCTLYFLIYRTILTNPFGISGNNSNSKVNKSSTVVQRQQEIRLAKKLSFLVGFLILSYLPMFTSFLILGFIPNFISLELFILFAWLRYLNSCINPFIYAFSVTGFKKAFREMFCWRGSQRGMMVESSNVTTAT